MKKSRKTVVVLLAWLGWFAVFFFLVGPHVPPWLNGGIAAGGTAFLINLTSRYQAYGNEGLKIWRRMPPPPVTYGSYLTVQGVIGSTSGDVPIIRLDHPLSIEQRVEAALEVGQMAVRAPVAPKRVQLTGRLRHQPLPGNDGHDVMILVQRIDWL